MKDYSSLELAFLGDAVHTLYVRKFALENFDLPMNGINGICASLCSAEQQARVLMALDLNETEADIARRARNVKSKHSSKNTSPIIYKQATAFEALVGYLSVTNQNERLENILNVSVRLR